MRRILAGAIALLASCFVAGPTLAQTQSATDTLSFDLVRTLSVTANGTSIKFGVVVAGNGTVSIGTNGSATYSSGIVHAHGTTSAATFTINGEGGQVITVSLSAPATLTSGSHTIPFSVPAGDQSGFGTSVMLSNSQGSAGTATAIVGGLITLTTATVPGTYTGTVSVTVSYN